MKNTHFVKSITLKKTHEIMWKNFVQLDRTQMTIWCMRIACCTPKATNTLSKYVILITCPQQCTLSLYLVCLHVTGAEGYCSA